MMREPGDPLVSMTLSEEGITGYWSPKSHPRLARFHQDGQQATLF